jgi:ribosomal protein S18 acetylase RimI-like enzyme
MAREDAWLSETLGFRALVADEPAASESVAERTLTTAKVPVDQIARVAAFEDAEFRVVDVNVTLARTGTRAASQPSVRAAGDRDRDAVLAIAGSSFRYSRFHLDPRIDDGLANHVKREWARSYVEGRRGLELLVAEADGRVAGFLAVLEDADARVIDLVGVSPELQGRGVGSALVAAFSARHEPHELRVGTQVANAPSLRLYANHGFVPASAAYVLHRHDVP